MITDNLHLGKAIMTQEGAKANDQICTILKIYPCKYPCGPKYRCNKLIDVRYEGSGTIRGGRCGTFYVNID
jgi:hypothetical protein